jgi:uncharacterized spore protein YtfJ
MSTDTYQPTRETTAPPVDAMIERIADGLGATVKASTIFGEPVERGGSTIIPVAKARWGFGGGGGGGQNENDSGQGGGGGGGGGMSISPVGYIAVGRGGSTFRLIRDPLAYLPSILVAGVLIALFARLFGRR